MQSFQEIWHKYAWLPIVIILYGGCAAVFLIGLTKHTHHKPSNPRVSKIADTVYWHDSAYVFKKHLDTVFKIEYDENYDNSGE